MLRSIIGLAAIILLLTSCFKEDDPMPAFPLQTTTIEMGKYYQYQYHFNLSENKKLTQIDKNTYDLVFESADSGWHIRLNTSAFMMAANTGEKDFEAVTDTTGLPWKFDNSNGNPDSTSIGNWLSITGNDTVYENAVYILNRGIDHLGNNRGLKKVKFSKVDKNTYTFSYADFNNENQGEFSLSKENNKKHAFFSFDDNSQLTGLEPDVNKWDLFFTQYTTLLFTDNGEPYPYLVTGVLSNYGNVKMAVDTIQNYDDITLETAQNVDYSIAWDFIGYDWKDIIGDVGSGNVYYEIVSNRTYLIRTKDEIYYKLRFVNFYNPDTGEKGYPMFVYEVL